MYRCRYFVYLHILFGDFLTQAYFQNTIHPLIDPQKIISNNNTIRMNTFERFVRGDEQRSLELLLFCFTYLLIFMFDLCIDYYTYAPVQFVLFFSFPFCFSLLVKFASNTLDRLNLETM